jgi:iron complex transport system substrate-binding protein
MKTKDKIVASVEIAIVLCSLFFVVLPVTAIAAEEDDYVLGIYGNANEDDTIDMRDLTYVKLIFFGKKPETELADAKYDGKINPLDFIQIKLIIVGKEKELTIVDSADRIVTVNKPVKRIVVLRHSADVVRMIGAKDKIVGVSTYIKDDKVYFPELSKLPSVGSVFDPDCEAILNLYPDLVITWPAGPVPIKNETRAQIDKKLPGIPVVGFSFHPPEELIEEQGLEKLGYILGKMDEVNHYFDDFHDKYIDLIEARTEKLTEEKKPKVYVERYTGAYKTYGSEATAHQVIVRTGGRNIFADIDKGFIDVDPEEVIMRNPNIIFKTIKQGYAADPKDPSKIVAMRDEIINRSELANVNAVKKGCVYIVDLSLMLGPDYPVAHAYWAKLFHPDLFEDLDPKAIHQEFLIEFQGLDYDLDEHGVFVYPPLTS